MIDPVMLMARWGNQSFFEHKGVEPSGNMTPTLPVKKLETLMPSVGMGQSTVDRIDVSLSRVFILRYERKCQVIELCHHSHRS